MSKGIYLGVLGTAIATASLMLPSVAAAADTVAAPTFTKDIAPIFQDKCEACHRPDSIAPMSLVTYEEARPWARSIRSRVETHQMPPWSIDKTIGIQEFKNDRSLSDAQVAYAATDVLHLHALRERLDTMLAREGRTELAQACFGFLPFRARLDLGGGEAEDIFAHS